MTIAKTIAKNTIFAFTQSVSELGIAFLTGIMLTRGLGTEQYGLYAYTVWLLSLIILGTNLGLGEMNRRFIPEAFGRQKTNEVAGFVKLALMLRTTLALVFCFAILLSSSFWAQQSGDPDNQFIFVLIAFTVLPNTITQSLIAVFKGFQKFDYSLYISLAMYPIRLILILIFMVLGFSILEVIILNIATLILGVLVGFYLLHRLIPLKDLFSPSLLPKDTMKQALRYSLTVAGMLALEYLVSQQTEIFFVGVYRSVEDVGYYTLAFRIGSMASLLPSSFAFVLLPIFSEQFGKREMEKMKRIYQTSVRYLMLVALPLGIGGIALANSIITLVYGADYKPVVLLYQALSVPIAISSITGPADSVIRGINRPVFLLKTLIVVSIINVGLSLWLVPKYGGMGAAIANSAPLVLILPTYAIFISKTVGASWPVRDTIKIAIASLIMGLIVYILQSQLGIVLGVVLCIPAGVVIYIIVILVLRVIQKEDIEILRHFQNSLPLTLRKYYILLIGWMERSVTKR